MGKGSYEYKAKKGLIRIYVKISEKKNIEDIKISGDFMLHPEDKIWELENILKGKNVERDNIEEIVRNILDDVEFIGSSLDDFIYVLNKAIEVALNE